MDQKSTASPSFGSIAVGASIDEIGLGYTAWFTDIWGVMHNGVRAFTGATEACRRHRARGGIVLLVSNSPRPRQGVIRQLDDIGVPRDAYDDVLTSGDATRSLLSRHASAPLFHLGPERDLGLYTGLPVSLVSEDAATAISCTGLFNDETEGPDDYRALLARFAEKNAPMVCANPDITVERGSKTIYCAGALAALYETLGGHVAYAGKPHTPIYEMAFARVSELAGRKVDATETLAIGDGIATDIKGAAKNGIASVFVAGPMIAARGLSQETLAPLFRDITPLPRLVLPELA